MAQQETQSRLAKNPLKCYFSQRRLSKRKINFTVNWFVVITGAKRNSGTQIAWCAKNINTFPETYMRV